MHRPCLLGRLDFSHSEGSELRSMLALPQRLARAALSSFYLSPCYIEDAVAFEEWLGLAWSP